MISSKSSTKVLVTGANGFIGLNTVLGLLQLDYSVRATVRNETHKKNIVETLSKYLDTSEVVPLVFSADQSESSQETVQLP